MALRLLNLRRLRQRRLIRRERVFRDRTNPFDIYSEREMLERYRFRKSDLVKLCDVLSDDLQFASAERLGMTSPMIMVLLTLRVLACGGFMLDIGDTFGLSKATVARLFHRVINVLAGKLSQAVKFECQAVADSTKAAFFAMAGFPNVVGCIDCTHVRIIAPSVNEHEFVNRKGYHSINVQLVCNANLRIMNADVKWPGCVHDARILKESAVYHDFDQVNRPITGVLLGDGGYMLRKWLITPFVKPATEAEERFNSSHCSTRSTIERCNGVLKRRWHCLHAELRYAPAKASKIIAACVVLHNWAIDFGTPLVTVEGYDGTDGGCADASEEAAADGQASITGKAARNAIVNRYFR